MNFILHQLDESLATQLCEAVSEAGHVFHATASTSECLAVAERLHADVVFCNADRGKYQSLLGALQRRGLPLSVVVVSRIPETSDWLDALDAGAADYCAAPFEHRHLSWLIQSAMLGSACTRPGAERRSVEAEPQSSPAAN
jgi:DNA-binding NtrC family response regulator